MDHPVPYNVFELETFVTISIRGEYLDTWFFAVIPELLDVMVSRDVGSNISLQKIIWVHGQVHHGSVYLPNMEDIELLLFHHYYFYWRIGVSYCLAWCIDQLCHGEGHVLRIHYTLVNQGIARICGE